MMEKMKNDLAQIESSDHLFVFADKTLNMYKMKPENYNKLLLESVTSTYKKVANDVVDEIDLEASGLINKNKIKNKKIPKLQKVPSFITLKDHKPKFPQKVSCRLINPSKNYMGKISKKILDDVNDKIRNATGLNQWRSTHEVFEWFNALEDKPNLCFVKFDVESFYPSITRSTLNMAIEFAKSYTEITDEEVEILYHTCKTVLYHEGEIWKKKCEVDFDVPMGSIHGAEVCELVGLLLLHQLNQSNIFVEGNFGIYRDDGLGVLKVCSRSGLERTEKKLRKVFQKFNLSITIETGMTRTDFLDTVLDVKNDRHEPYRKPNSEVVYVHRKSNHPSYIIKQIPESINARLSKLSKNESIFNKNKEIYESALKSGNYERKLEYEEVRDQNINKGIKKKRKRKVLYYNPPYCKSVETNIGKRFLQLVDKHFHEKHKYRKLFNRNNLKISYCCMPNIKMKIMAHNRKLIDENAKENQDTKTCNCRRKELCPMNGECLASNLVYRATVKSEKETKYYVGSTGNTFKERYSQHKHSFNNKNLKHTNATGLAKYIRKLKSEKTDYEIKWEILCRTKNKLNMRNGCTLCNMEKFEIDKAKGANSLNKRTELKSKCVHYRRKFF